MTTKQSPPLCDVCEEPADTRAHEGHGPQAHPFVKPKPKPKPKTEVPK